MLAPTYTCHTVTPVLDAIGARTGVTQPLEVQKSENFQPVCQQKWTKRAKTTRHGQRFNGPVLHYQTELQSDGSSPECTKLCQMVPSCTGYEACALRALEPGLEEGTSQAIELQG